MTELRASADVLLHARATSDRHYVEIHARRSSVLSERQEADLERALTFLLRASVPEPIQSEIEIGIAQLPWIDDDQEAGGDPGGKLMLPDPRPEREGPAAS